MNDKVSKKEPQYFTVKQLDSIGRGFDVVFLYSTRSDGKSYAVKSRVLLDAFNNINKEGICTKQFAYIRRYDLENKDSKIQKYFADMPIQEITDGKYTHLFVYSHSIYFGHIENNKKVKDVKIGDGFSIAGATHNKSEAYPYTDNIIMEEATERTGHYLYNEPSEFLHAVSTITRNRETAKIYMIANVVSRQCPYFEEWQLHPEKLQDGESNIVTFHDDEEDVTTKLIIYKVLPAGSKSRLFFGRARDNITKGRYHTELQKHLKHPPERYTKLHTVVLEYDSFKYLLDFIFYTDYDMGSDYAWYITPKTTEVHKNTRLVTNQLTHGGKYVTDSFYGLSPDEVTAFRYLFDKTKVFFSDNLTGTEFYDIIENFR